MSKYLTTLPRLGGEAATVEGRLADIMETADEISVDGYDLSKHDRSRVIAALRGAAFIIENLETK